MAESRVSKVGRSRIRADARLRSATKRLRAGWTPQRTSGLRSTVKYLISRALRPYDRHSREVLGGVVQDLGTATLGVADDVDAIQRKAGALESRVHALQSGVKAVQNSVTALHSKIDAEQAERAAFDTFVTAEMDKAGLELHAKRSRFCSYLGDHLAVCRVLGNLKMFVDTRDHVLAPHLMTDGYWESWITLAMLRALEPGMVAVDVGANYGYFSIVMGRCVGRTGKVVAFEPNPYMAGLARKSLWISGIRQIDEVREEAAYSTTGEQVRFFIPDERPMNARVVEAAPYAGTLIDVPTVRLDDVLPDKVDFIKIDAEGGEREIWRGMSKIIENNPQLQIFLEFNPKRTAHYDPHEFLKTIREDGFAIAKVAYDGSYELVDGDKLIANGSEQILYLRRARAEGAQ
jgi:FkbM family methyltransferase